jgi:cytochrome P450
MAYSHAQPPQGAMTSAPNRRNGPRGLPFLGSLLDFGRDQLGFVSGCAREYGDIVEVSFVGWPIILVSDMAAIEKILVKEHRSFIKNRIVWRHVTALFGKGLLTSEGAFWHRQRRLAAPPFAHRQLVTYGPDIVALADAAAERWHDGEIVDIHPHMMSLTLRIAAKTLFDAAVEEDIADIDHALNDLIVEMEARFKRPFVIPDAVPLPGHLRYRRAIRTVERVVARMVAERRRDGVEGRTDFLSRIMAARDEQGQGMTDAQLRDEAMTLLLAGHETTALAMSWALHLLSLNPEVQERLVAELEEVLGDRDAGVEDVDALPYTEAVINEAMRVYPPAWLIGRESTEPFEINGKTYAAGTTVLVSPWVLHRDPRYFDDPEVFRPERWLDGLAERLPRFAFMPFGGGPRICIGQRFAMIEAVLMTATLARRFSFEGQRDRPPKPFPSITLRPEGGVWVKLGQRQMRN